MTEERASHYAKVLARGVTFYVVRSREGRFLAVQIPSEDWEIIAKISPSSSTHDTQQFGLGHARNAA